jgi:hypothetical protein
LLIRRIIVICKDQINLNEKAYLLIVSIWFLSSIWSQDNLDVQWSFSIGGEDEDRLMDLLQHEDGGMIMFGSSRSGISGDKTDTCRGNFDYWMVKIDEHQQIEWQHTYGGSGSDELVRVLPSMDGGYFLAGTSNSNISGNKAHPSYGGKDYWLIKTNVDGYILWQKTIGGNQDDYLADMVMLSDGSLLLAGTSLSDSSGWKSEPSRGAEDFWVVNLTNEGEYIWDKTVGGDTLDELYDAHLTMDNGILLSGYSLSNSGADKTSELISGTDYWVVKLNELGEIENDFAFGGTNQSVYAHCLQTLDGNFIVAGTSSSSTAEMKSENSHGGIAYWVIKFDPLGEIIWENTIGGEGFDFLADMHETLDGNIHLIGYSDSFESFDKTEDSDCVYGSDDNFWYTVLNEDGEVVDDVTVNSENKARPTVIKMGVDGNILIGGYTVSKHGCEKFGNKKGGNDFWVVSISECPEINNQVTELVTSGIHWGLSADFEEGNYQWYKCLDNGDILELSGETDRQFNPVSELGTYFVKITYESCEVYSDCYYATDFYGVEEIYKDELIIYPNPTREVLYINGENVVSISIMNLNDQLLLEQPLQGNIINVSSLSEGTYLILLRDINGQIKSRQLFTKL